MFFKRSSILHRKLVSYAVVLFVVSIVHTFFETMIFQNEIFPDVEAAEFTFSKTSFPEDSFCNYAHKRFSNLCLSCTTSCLQ